MIIVFFNSNVVVITTAAAFLPFLRISFKAQVAFKTILQNRKTPFAELKLNSRDVSLLWSGNIQSVCPGATPIQSLRIKDGLYLLSKGSC